MSTRLRPPPGRKKLTIIRCRFTVREFIATTSAVAGTDQFGERAAARSR